MGWRTPDGFLAKRRFTVCTENVTEMTSNEKVGLVNLVVALPTEKCSVCQTVNKGFFLA